MNCIQYRRSKLADARRSTPEALQHARGCPACMTFSRGADAFEQRLEAALLVPPPAGLAERVLRAHAVRARRSAWRFALAATILLVLGVFARLFLVSDAGLAWAVAEHVLAEPEVLAANQPVAPEQLALAFARVGGSVNGTLLDVRYHGRCNLAGGTGEHLVVDTPLGKATVILLPRASVVDTVRLARAGLITQIKPAGHGGYAISAQTDEVVELVEDLVQKSVSWDS